MAEAVVIEAALNGARSRAELPAVPLTPVEIAEEARRCADHGASVVHVHARTEEGGWSADPGWYADALRRIRSAVLDVVVGITSLRPVGIPVSVVLDLLAAQASDQVTRPDLVSANLGHIVAWEPTPSGAPFQRRTVHFPNDYEDIAALLAICTAHGIVPEHGLMDLGFVSNAVALRDDGLLPERPWFLIELDSPSYGSGAQVAPSSTANYDALAGPLRDHVPQATWAAHGNGLAGYSVLRRALEDGAHVRVGFEDAVLLPDGASPRSNTDLVTWAVAAARAVGRAPASGAEARVVIGLPPASR